MVLSPFDEVAVLSVSVGVSFMSAGGPDLRCGMGFGGRTMRLAKGFAATSGPKQDVRCKRHVPLGFGLSVVDAMGDPAMWKNRLVLGMRGLGKEERFEKVDWPKGHARHVGG